MDTAKPRVLVVNGGPGMGCSYIKFCLEPASDDIEFLYYDQLGCATDTTRPETVDLTQLVAQFEEAMVLAGANHVLAHSWGTHIALSSPRLRIADQAKVLFCNPCPLTAQTNSLAENRLLARIPEDVRVEIEHLARRGDDESGRKLMELALPYYCGRLAPPIGMPLDYRIGTYSAVMHSVEGYDLRSIPASLNCSVGVLLGTEDYIVESDARELIDRADVSVRLEGAGHFAIAEAPDEALDFIRSFFSSAS